MFAQKKADPRDDVRKHAAAVKIQCLIRKFLAVRYVSKRAKKTWQRVFDPVFKIYFFYNRLNGQSQWTVPRFIDLFSDKDIESAKLLQRIVRSFIGRMRARKVAHQKYTRFYDSNVNKFYWMVNATQQTSWKASPWLMRQEIPMPPEDQMLYNSAQKIKELEAMLKQKEKEIKDVRKKRYEELEPLVLQDRVANAKSLQRSKNMDEWTIDQLAAWFTELKMDDYIPFLYSNRSVE